MKTLKVFLGLFLLCFLGGCENYTEDFGFYMNFSKNIYTTSIHANPDSYSLTLYCPFELQAGKMDIREVGFYYDDPNQSGVKIKAVGECSDNGQVVLASINQLPYNKQLQVYPYILTPQGEILGSTASILYSKEYFQPVVDSYKLTMPEVGKIRMEVDYRLADTALNVNQAKVVFSGKSLNTEIQKEKIFSEFDLSDLTAADAEGLEVSLTNEMGERSITVPFSVLVSEKDTLYSDEGEKDDCIRLCGVDWAKGNLMYDNGTWRLGKTQDETFYYKNENYSSNQNEYFSFGDVSENLYTGAHVSWYTHAFDEYTNCSIIGDPAADVVSAHLSGWTLPSRRDFQNLVDHASWQYGYTLQGQNKVYGVLFYTKSDKNVRSLTPVLFDSEKLNELGLFLPAMGVWSFGNQSYGKTIWYMSGEAYKELTVGPPYNFIGKVYHLEQYNQNLEVDDDTYSSSNQFNVRPVKGTVKENSYQRKLEITEGSVVDLGLSVKWASSNVGATSPEEGGLAFRLSQAGYGGYDTSLWRIPSREEVEELLNKCEWNWGYYNGVNGYQVKGPNGNSIFLPACEVQNHVGLYRVGAMGYGMYDYTIDVLGISSQNNKLCSYSKVELQDYSDSYRLRLVSID